MEMTMKATAILALGLLAPAAFGQTAAMTPATQVATHTLRSEIKRDQGDMTGKTKAFRAERKELLVQEKAELVKITASKGNRAQKKAARQAVRVKYAQLIKDARAKAGYQRKNLRDDMTSKRVQIKKLRQS
jgi:ribosome-binding protein aMBF1 (putative translation factor)